MITYVYDMFLFSFYIHLRKAMVGHASFYLRNKTDSGFPTMFYNRVLLISLWVQFISLLFHEILFSHFHAVIFFFKSISKTSELLIRIHVDVFIDSWIFFFWTSCYICIKCKYKVFWHVSDILVYRWTCVTCVTTVNSSLTWVDVLQYMVSKIFLSPKKMSWVVDK